MEYFSKIKEQIISLGKTIIILSIIGLIIMICWNYIAEYFTIKTITFGVAFCITLLLRIVSKVIEGLSIK